MKKRKKRLKLCTKNRNKYKTKSKVIKRTLEERLLIQLARINYNLRKNKMLDLIELTGKPVKLMVRNFTSGIFKGIGFGIGFSIVTAIIIYFAQKIIVLNIPIISEYISDIVEIVKESK